MKRGSRRSPLLWMGNQMAVLETSFLIDVLRNKDDAKKVLGELSQNNETLFIAAPSVTELWEGALWSIRAEKEKILVNQLLAALHVLPLDEKSAKKAASIKFELRDATIGYADILIAAIAIEKSQMLVTRDGHYSKIAGLKALKY